jgi:hypothetical protein
LRVLYFIYAECIYTDIIVCNNTIISLFLSWMVQRFHKLVFSEIKFFFFKKLLFCFI